MRILVTGSTGQLSRSLTKRAAAAFPQLAVATIGRPLFNLERLDELCDAIHHDRPELLINAAAYTAVDQAELEPSIAEQVNAIAPEVLAAAAKKLGIPFIHLSTDYVFDGSSNAAYSEDARPNPKSVYGRTKLAGEQAVQRADPSAMIVRTSWVYSPFGRNFVKTMLALAETRDDIGVVADQFGTPTSALDLANGLLTAAARWQEGHRTGRGEIYHLAGRDTLSWYDFAQAVFVCARERSLPIASVRPITSEEFPTQAARPVNSALDSNKFARDFFFDMPQWKVSLGRVMDQVLAEQAAFTRRK